MDAAIAIVDGKSGERNFRKRHKNVSMIILFTQLSTVACSFFFLLPLLIHMLFRLKTLYCIHKTRRGKNRARLTYRNDYTRYER